MFLVRLFHLILWRVTHTCGPELKVMRYAFDSGYELQIYNRVLTTTGLELSYSRIRDGEVLRTVDGTLIRR